MFMRGCSKQQVTTEHLIVYMLRVEALKDSAEPPIAKYMHKFLALPADDELGLPEDPKTTIFDLQTGSLQLGLAAALENLPLEIATEFKKRADVAIKQLEATRGEPCRCGFAPSRAEDPIPAGAAMGDNELRLVVRDLYSWAIWAQADNVKTIIQPKPSQNRGKRERYADEQRDRSKFEALFSSDAADLDELLVFANDVTGEGGEAEE